MNARIDGIKPGPHASRSRGWLITCAGVLVAVLSLGWWSDRGSRIVTDGPHGGAEYREFDVLSPFWPGVIVGAFVVGIGMAVLLGATSRVINRAGAVCAGLMILGTAWLATFVRLGQSGYWADGRPVRRPDGSSVLPATEGGTGHAAANLWIEAARCEASSAIEFDHLAAHLRTLGAPAELIAAACNARSDERHHVDRCLEIANHLNPTSAVTIARQDVLAVPPTPSLSQLALSAYLDGVLGEGFAIARLEWGARQLEGDVGAIMRQLSVDETRHVDLAWATVAWGLAAGGTRVRWTLRAAAALRPRQPAPPPAVHSTTDSSLRSAGVPDAATAQSLWHTTRAAARQRLCGVLSGEQPLHERGLTPFV